MALLGNVTMPLQRGLGYCPCDKDEEAGTQGGEVTGLASGHLDSTKVCLTAGPLAPGLFGVQEETDRCFPK